MTEIEKTLAERGARYGDFAGNACTSQYLKSVMKAAPKWGDLTLAQMESLEMIAHKIGRMLNGDTTYLDNVVDIIGYATLMLQAMGNGQETKKN